VIANDIDFRTILYDNILFKGKATLRDASNLPLPDYAINNNDHYKALEKIPGLNLKTDLEQVVQSDFNFLPPEAASGVLTSRAAAKAFFVDGTNRAMFRFTVLNHLCQDMDQLKDVTMPADRIRQDVSRSPGGDSRIFMNECIGCHSGMDPMTQAFAYYDYEYPLDGNNDPLFEQGHMVYNKVGTTDIDKNGNDTGTRVQAKNHINADNFKPGFIVPDDSWVNFWRNGKNSALNWDTSLPASGNGASSMAKELAHSEQFARCQVEKVFKAVCLHPPLDVNDRTEVTKVLGSFTTGGYKLKQVFAETAVYCKGE
jgi:hypothetical protein